MPLAILLPQIADYILNIFWEIHIFLFLNVVYMSYFAERCEKYIRKLIPAAYTSAAAALLPAVVGMPTSIIELSLLSAADASDVPAGVTFGSGCRRREVLRAVSQLSKSSDRRILVN